MRVTAIVVAASGPLNRFANVIEEAGVTAVFACRQISGSSTDL